MKPILIYDSETTGLPVWDKPSEDPSQPRITQLCAELCDGETGETIAGFQTIIKPDGWTIPAELETLTGITNEKALAFGLPMSVVLPIFVRLWQKAEFRVGHNESFDMRMIRIELMRHEEMKTWVVNDDVPFADVWKKAPAFCTMGKSTSILALPPSEKMKATGRRGPKPPNLGEAYHHFTGTLLAGAHNAAIDVSACKAVYFGIKSHNASVQA